jgi:lambda family phage portal protein
MTKNKLKGVVNQFAQLYDQAISIFAPQVALKNKLTRQVLNRAYEGADRNRFNRNHFSESVNRELSYDLQGLRDHSRHLTKNDSFAAGAIESKVTNVVGCGMRFQSQINTQILGIDTKTALKYSQAIEQHWQLWGSKPWCDVANQCDFTDLQELMYRSNLDSGDVFAVLVYDANSKSPYKLKIQLIEADLVFNPERKADDFKLPGIAGGVERNADGEVIAIHVSKEYDALLNNFQTRRIPVVNEKTGRQQVFHLSKMKRPMQNRGLPDLTPIITTLKQFTDYNQAEAEAALMNALFAVFIESDEPDVFGGSGIPSQSNTEQDRNVTPANEIELNGKAVHVLRKGEKIQSVSAVRPNQSYGSFVDALVKQLAMGLNVSSEVLMKHFDSSYSASRAAMLESWRTFYKERSFLVRKVLQPILEEFVYYLVVTGEIELPNYLSGSELIRYAYTKGIWIGDAEGQIDEVKEIKAAQMRMGCGITTLETETSRLGGVDWQENLRQRREEVDYIGELQLEGRINYAQLVQNAGNEPRTEENSNH